MFVPISSFHKDFAYPNFVIEGLPEGHNEPVICDTILREILNIVREGEEVEVMTRPSHGTVIVDGISREIPYRGWDASRAQRATPFGMKLDELLKDGQNPRFRVESVILRVDDKGDQRVYYKFSDHDEPVRAVGFCEPSEMTAFISGVVGIHDNRLVLFSFGGISELASREPTGEVIPLKIEPTKRGALSFQLYTEYCAMQSTNHHYSWRYDEPKSVEAWKNCEASARVLLGESPFEPSDFHQLCGRFRIRRIGEGAVLDGFADNRREGDCGMLDTASAFKHVEKLRTYLAGYTPARMERLTRYLEEIAQDFDPVTANPHIAKEILTDICKLVEETKKDHDAAPLSDYWEPAADILSWQQSINLERGYE